MLLPLQKVISELADSNKPLLNFRLINLSNLKPKEVSILEQSWHTIESKRRCQIIYRLVVLSQDHIELNFDSIFKNCLKDHYAEVRSKAIEGLWESWDTSLVNLLVNLLEQDNSEKVQSAAATALGKFAMLVEYNKLRSSYTPRIYQALLTTIHNKNKAPEIRRHTLEAVAPLSLPQVREAIKEAYQGVDSKLRISSIYAMGKNCDHSWLPLLLQELANVDAEMRYAAVRACAELGEEKVVLYLTKLINDPDTDVQMATFQALGKIGGSEAKKYLEQCQHSPSKAMRQATDRALQEIETWEDPFSFMG